MVKCSFCDNDFPKGTGKIFVKKEGTIFYFCSNKCEKNLFKLKRSRRKTKWAERYHQIKKSGKE